MESNLERWLLLIELAESRQKPTNRKGGIDLEGNNTALITFPDKLCNLRDVIKCLFKYRIKEEAF
jgi:hypothetical protein